MAWSSKGSRWLLLVGLFLLLPLVSVGQETNPQVIVYLTQEQAFKLAFPDAKMEKKTVTLTDEQQKAALARLPERMPPMPPGMPTPDPKKPAAKKLPSPDFTYYAATDKDGKPLGYAVIDSQITRTELATYIMAVDPTLKITSVEMMVFREGKSYTVASPQFYDSFQGKSAAEVPVLAKDSRNPADLPHVLGAP